MSKLIIRGEIKMSVKYSKAMKSYNRKIEQKQAELDDLKERRNNFIISAFEEITEKRSINIDEAFDIFISLLEDLSNKDDESLNDELQKNEIDTETEKTEEKGEKEEIEQKNNIYV